jgi:alpha-L-arabinofuranosidase
LKGKRVKCSLDGKIIHDIEQPRIVTHGLYASTTRDSTSGDLIVKVVNTAATPTETDIQFDGANKLGSSARAIVLTSESPRDENTLEEPTKVSPKEQSLSLSGKQLKHAFPGNSLTVLRVKTEK